MKKILSILSMLLASLVIQAQGGSWKVSLNNKLLVTTNKEDDKLNSLQLKSSEWKRNGWLEVSFKEDSRGPGLRSFLLADEKDNQVLVRDSTTYFKISVSTLRKSFAGKKEIRIYTLLSPPDPRMMIRTSRMHLYTLRLP